MPKSIANGWFPLTGPVFTPSDLSETRLSHPCPPAETSSPTTEPLPPPEDLTKVWVEVDPDRFLQKAVHMKSTAYGVGVYTHVYMYKKTGEIRGTVTPMKNGLWNAMMYNGRQNVFYTDKLAKEWVENYKPHIVK